MIRVNKPACPPARLQRGIARTAQDCVAYDANGIDYRNGARTFNFEKNIYGHQTVKAVLRQAQHGKCCFCERKLETAHVEHYRPKGAVRQDEDSEMLHPGYYWLAYSWDNLYLSCHGCNSSHKREFFPLANPEARARSHGENIANENPLLLDPGGVEDPRNHIKFRQERAVGLAEAGCRSIRVVGLNRPTLVEDRLERWKILDALRNLVRLATGHTDQNGITEQEGARDILTDAVLPQAVFSAMASDLLRGEPVQTEAP